MKLHTLASSSTFNLYYYMFWREKRNAYKHIEKLVLWSLLLQMTSSRPSGNDQGVHRLDSDLRLAPLHASVDELVSGFDSSSEIDILQCHRDGLERDHERVHHAVMEPR